MRKHDRIDALLLALTAFVITVFFVHAQGDATEEINPRVFKAEKVSVKNTCDITSGVMRRGYVDVNVDELDLQVAVYEKWLNGSATSLYDIKCPLVGYASCTGTVVNLTDIVKGRVAAGTINQVEDTWVIEHRLPNLVIELGFRRVRVDVETGTVIVRSDDYVSGVSGCEARDLR